MAFIAADSYHSTISSIAGGTGITSFSVASGSGFPALASGDFTIMRLDDGGTPEDIVCTGISGTTVTCLPTTAAHANGNAIDGAILTTGALAQIKDDAISGFPVNAFSAAGALVKGTGVRNHGTVTSASCTMTLADGTYKGELCRISIDRTSTKQVTVDPASSTLWDGQTTIALFAGDNIIGTWDGTGWVTLAKYSSIAPAPSMQRLVAGNYFIPAFGPALGSTAVFATTETRWTPIYIGAACTISELGCRIQTGFAGGNLQIALYANGSNNLPTGAPLAQTGNISTTTGTLTVSGSVTNVQIQPGIYWLGFQVDNTTVTLSTIGTSEQMDYAFSVGVSVLADLWSSNTAMGVRFQTTGGTFGTFVTNPTVVESSAVASWTVRPVVKIASVP